MLDLFLKGGALMWPLLICSIVMLAIVIERFAGYSRIKNNDAGLLDSVRKLLLKKKHDEAAKACVASASPVAAVLYAGIKARKMKPEEREAAVKAAGSREIKKLDKNLRGLAIIANISPLLGLLGTVTGLIRAFMKIEELGGRVDASILAGGIWEALITTVAGLGVAIISVVFYHYFESVVDAQSAKMSDAVARMNEWLHVGLKPGRHESMIIKEIENGV